MTWAKLGQAAMQLVILWVTQWLEKNVEKKKKKKEALEEVKTGIKERDPSKITSGFDKARNA